MALFPCNGSGGTMAETTLWTNPSPTSAYAGGDITLSKDMDNFKYIKFTFRFSTTDSNELSLILSVADVKASTISAVGFCTAISGRVPNGYTYARRISYKTDTSVNITLAEAIGSSATINSAYIPISIKGLS